ncbi:hypothetical protein K432DRAFT_446651 [Lepidopterella palustris CBS 459.81]|uniref:Uncharacterized protein n=1 Tax=Lepidopterella palustris CBS 459.81 TaxID=1314670 RepID=A0A8E2JAS4_9PEZI|nr:hypothetical protein K432DRAFT_446651 [Lepidopterella palustris CBS 459.81]
MVSRRIFIAALVAIAEARFGQEQIPISAISSVTSGGAPGQAATIAGAAISDLLAGANACAKLQRADQIIAELGTGADAVAAAIGMVTAEKNFNPFTQSIPTICNDPTLPVTQQLRGITPKIDPAVVGSDVANALSASSAKSPLDATGKSVADLLAANGFTNFTGQAAAANAATAGNTPVATASSAPATSAAAVAATSSAAAACAVAPVASSSVAAVVSSATSASAATASTPAVSSNVQKSTIAGLDFGLCVPTMKFEGGLGGRPATEFTFQLIDKLAGAGQQEALNPNIITNRICDQLTNVCEANAAAKTACTAAKAQISALGTRDKSTADAWNTALGFAGTVTNPDGGPAEPAASASVAGRRAVRFMA